VTVTRCLDSGKDFRVLAAGRATAPPAPTLGDSGVISTLYSMNRGPRLRRFAFVCPNYYPRTCGVGDFSMRLGQELMRRGFEVALFSRAPAQVNPEAPEIRVFAAEGASPLVIIGRLRSQIDAFAPTDLIIQYTPQMLGAWRWGSPATLWLAAWARRRKINLVLLAHELYLRWDRRPDLALAAASLRLQLATLMRMASHVLVTMEMRVAEVARLARIVGVNRRAGVVRIGTAAIPVTKQSTPGRLRIGMFSTLASTKRFDVLLECFRIVQARRPEAELVILGDLGDPGNARMRAFTSAIAAHPARERISQPGKQSLSEIAREVANLDVYLFTMVSGANSRSSTLPLALGTGLPVVAIRGYETDDLFVDGDNILFASGLSGEAFADAVLSLHADEKLARRLSEGALRIYRDYFSWDRIADQFLKQI
jgi:glycosyltransferase involved in cell wall biosynthesis